MRIRESINRRTQIVLNVLGVAAAVGFYFYLSHHQHLKNPDDTTIPTFSQLTEGWEKIWTKDTSGERWITEDMYATFKRHLIGLGGGVLISVVLGVAMGCFAAVEALFRPLNAFLAKIPPTAMLAVFFVLVGTDEALHESIIMFGVSMTLALTVLQAVKYDVPMNHIDKAYTLGYSTLEVVLRVFRQILPRILEAIRLSIGPAMVFLIASEWNMGDVGFGYRLRIQSRMTNMNVVYIYLVILGITCYLMDASVALLRKKLCPWFED